MSCVSLFALVYRKCVQGVYCLIMYYYFIRLLGL